MSAELRKNIVYVVSNGRPADVEPFGDGQCANAPGQQLQNLLLPARKSRLRIGHASGGWGLRAKAGQGGGELADKVLHRFLAADIPEDMYEGDPIARTAGDKVTHVEP